MTGKQREDTQTSRPRILIITPIEGIEAIATHVASRLGAIADIAANRSAALRVLERKSYSVVVLDQMLADSDPEGAEVLWKRSGLAVPLQLTLAIAGSARLEREVRAALSRRGREEELAREAAVAALDSDLKNAVTASLLEAQLALREEAIPPRVENRLRTIEAVAQRMRAALQRPGSSLSPDRGIETSNHTL